MMSRETVWKGHQCLWLFHFFKKQKSKITNILNQSLIFKKSLILYT